MKITAYGLRAVNIPLVVPFLFSVGTYPGDTKVVVEVFTDEGITGLGEAPAPECAAVIDDQLAPALTGLNPLDIQACERACIARPAGHAEHGRQHGAACVRRKSRSACGISAARHSVSRSTCCWAVRSGKTFPSRSILHSGRAGTASAASARRRPSPTTVPACWTSTAPPCSRASQLGDPLLEIASVKAIRHAIGDAAVQARWKHVMVAADSPQNPRRDRAVQYPQLRRSGGDARSHGETAGA